MPERSFETDICLPSGDDDRALDGLRFRLPATVLYPQQAIERCKQDGLPRNGPIRNPNVKIDPVSGEVFPEVEGGGIGDSIGNIRQYL